MTAEIANTYATVCIHAAILASSGLLLSYLASVTAAPSVLRTPDPVRPAG